MAGTSLEAAYEDARDAYGEALTIAGRALNHAAQSIAWKINIPSEENVRPLVVFNPLTWPVKANVEIESSRLKPEMTLVDESGNVIPHQGAQSTTTAGRDRLCFTADLPALGYRTYRLLLSSDTVQDDQTRATLQASDNVLESNRFRLEFDPVTGCIASLRDKQEDVEVFSGPAALPVVLDDPADTWGHNVFKWDKVDGAFQAESVRLVEHGPVKSVIRVTSRYGSSRLVQDFAMYPDREQIDVSVMVDWHEQLKMLKLRFPVNVKFMKVTYEIPYGHTERFANGEEEPGQSWVDVSGVSRDQGNSLWLQLTQRWQIQPGCERARHRLDRSAQPSLCPPYPCCARAGWELRLHRSGHSALPLHTIPTLRQLGNGWHSAPRRRIEPASYRFVRDLPS